MQQEIPTKQLIILFLIKRKKRLQKLVQSKKTAVVCVAFSESDPVTWSVRNYLLNWQICQSHSCTLITSFYINFKTKLSGIVGLPCIKQQS